VRDLQPPTPRAKEKTIKPMNGRTDKKTHKEQNAEIKKKAFAVIGERASEIWLYRGGIARGLPQRETARGRERVGKRDPYYGQAKQKGGSNAQRAMTRKRPESRLPRHDARTRGEWVPESKEDI